MFMGMDALTVQFLAHKARKLARKWGGQCIVFIDEIDAVGLRRQALGSGSGMTGGEIPGSINELGFYGPSGAVNAGGDLIVESRAWREHMFGMRAEPNDPPYGAVMGRIRHGVERIIGGIGGMGYQGQALNQLLVVMDGMGEPPVFKKFFVNRFNTFLDALFVVPRRLGALRLRLSTPAPRKEEIYFIGACNVPIEALDPALIRAGRMGRHIWFRTPTKDDRKDIFDLYMAKVDHEPDLDTDRRRDELARITNGYSPSMIEQCCSMALTIAHTEGRAMFAWRDIVEAMTTVETGTAQNIDYIIEETRAVAIHEAGHAAAGHVYLGDDLLSTRLSIRKRGGSLGHYQSMEKEERFSHFRSYYMGRLIMVLGAMAAEHVFYGENSAGVSGDVYSATATAAAMVGIFAMGPDPVAFNVTDFEPTKQERKQREPLPMDALAEVDDETQEVLRRLTRIGSMIMNRSDGSSALQSSPVTEALRDRGKYNAAAQLIGQAYVTAYSLIATNRAAIEEIAEVLIERKEMHGDEVVDLLDSVGLVRPQIDLRDDSTWPTV
jgi:ATP-dependent Zn protease